ncbi:outer membrane lipoprotein carrier protein LolA [Pendulispora rubella]|uniref:Outer membrane lipoprotein carrier protein LolA n=1 Tax=Pendulispora rubella TaxID=2741070 RepID=A0ABZ2LAV3_9BACT
MRHLRSFAPATLVSVLALASLAVVPSASHAQPAAAAAATPPVDQAVTKVQAFYEKTTSFKAGFTQEFFVKAYNQRKNSRGKVTFAKPGKMEWVYDEPKDNKVVSDGATLRVYEASNKQMFETPVDKNQGNYAVALSFLTGQGKLTDHFTFEIAGGDKMAFPGGYVLVGTPKVPQPAYTKVFFYVDAASSQVRRVMVLDGQGNRNRFDFENPRINEPVTEGQFKFTPPAGTTVVKP